MRTVLNRLSVELIVTEPVQRLCVKVLYGKGMGEKSITLDHTVQVVWHVSVLASLVVQRTGVASLNVVRNIF